MATRLQLDLPALSRPAFHQSPRRGSGPAWWAWMRGAVMRWHERRLLEQLDEHALHDIGISRSQALAEASKPFWRR